MPLCSSVSLICNVKRFVPIKTPLADGGSRHSSFLLQILTAQEEPRRKSPSDSLGAWGPQWCRLSAYDGAASPHGPPRSPSMPPPYSPWCEWGGPRPGPRGQRTSRPQGRPTPTGTEDSNWPNHRFSSRKEKKGAGKEPEVRDRKWDWASAREGGGNADLLP